MTVHGPSVLMLVINPMTNDSRVEREASALASQGYQVTVVARHGPGLPGREWRQGYEIWRVPYRWVTKEWALAEKRRASKLTSADLRGLRSVWRQAPWLPRPHLVRGLAVTHGLRLAVNIGRALGSAVVVGALLRTIKSAAVPVDYWRGTILPVEGALPRPDVIHAHDLGTLAAAIKLADRWKRRAPHFPRPCVVFDSHELYIEQNPRWGVAEYWSWRLHEWRWIRRANVVITVSDSIARALKRRYLLRAEPQVIINSPDEREFDEQEPRTVRSDVGKDGVPLVVYAGTAKPARGTAQMVEALALSSGWDLCLVGAGASDHVTELTDRATELRVRERLHILPSVPAQTLPRYLSDATLGVHALQDTCLNHKFALPNKLFDYIFAGLPVAVPRGGEMEAFVSKWQCGVTFDPSRPAEISRAILDAVARAEELRPNRNETAADLRRLYGWPSQARRLLALYAQVLQETEK